MVTGFVGIRGHFFQKTLFTFKKKFIAYIEIGVKKWAFDQSLKTPTVCWA